MLRKIICKSTSAFASDLANAEIAARDAGIPLFLLFTGEKGATGKSWCPDCVVADPIITDSLNTYHPKGCILLEMPVVREEYRQPTYLYRTTPEILLRCVPTLMRWKDAKCANRLNDDQCQVKDIVDLLVQEE